MQLHHCDYHHSMNERTPPDIRAWTALARAHRGVLDHVEAALKAVGLPSLAWYDVLLELDRGGSDGLRPYVLEERLLLRQYALSRLIDRIARAGLVERRPCPDDRRGHVVALTAAGATMRRRMWPVYRRAISEAIGEKLDERACDQLAASLRLLT